MEDFLIALQSDPGNKRVAVFWGKVARCTILRRPGRLAVPMLAALEKSGLIDVEGSVQQMRKKRTFSEI
jgi:hypothetical protein